MSDMAKASELRDMSDEQVQLTWKEAAETCSVCGFKRRPSDWTHRAN